MHLRARHRINHLLCILDKRNQQLEKIFRRPKWANRAWSSSFLQMMLLLTNAMAVDQKTPHLEKFQT